MYRQAGSFPAVERFELASQLRRAATSIALNFAEGWGRYSARDKQHFYRMSRASLLECVAILDIALRQKYLGNNLHDRSMAEAESLSRMLNKLMQSQRNRE
jgi:four helix bundle protein